MLKLSIGYPSKTEEREIMDRMAETGKQIVTTPVVTPEQILKARKTVDSIYMDDKIKNYIVDIVFATRDPKAYNLDIAGLIQYGASPRATIYLALCAKAFAFLQGRGYVTPQDVKTIGMDVLRHRVIVSYEAEAEEMTSESIIKRIFDEVPVP
jgi:MoxR-like ATPase